MSQHSSSRISDPARLDALCRLGLLDQPSEPNFERFVNLVCQTIDVPVALVSLVDSDRQFFQAACGLAEPWASARETPLSHSFCQHVVNTGTPLIITDAREHALLADNGAIRDLGVIAYAGYPLITLDNQVIGSFCAIDTVPREWSSRDLGVIENVAHAVAAEMNLRDQIRQHTIALRDLAQSQRFLQRTLDALADHIAILDEHGMVIAVNQAWRSFATSNGTLDSDFGLGANYLVVCEAATGDCASEVHTVADGIRAILAGERVTFSLEYPCHSPTEQRWYNVRVSRFDDTGQPRIVVAHENITERKLLEDAQRESEARYRSVIAALQEGIVLQHADGSIRASNTSAEEILGLTASQMMGHTSLDPRWRAVRADNTPFPGEEHPAIVTLRTGQPCSNVAMGVHKPDGTLTWININSRPLFRADEAKPYAVVSSLTDMTTRRQAEAELTKLSLVASKTETGVVITDRYGATEWVNEGFQRLSGYTLADLCGKKPGSLLQGPQTDQRTIAHIRDELATKQPFQQEILNYHKNGTPYWILMNITPILNEQDEVTQFIAVETDITHRKELERMKNDFVALVSHELRTPLTSIRGALGLVAGGIAGELPPQARTMIDIACNNSERLVRMINDILDIEKIESGKMSFVMQNVELLPLLTQTIEANTGYAEQFGTRIELEHGECEHLLLHADGDRLIQVFTNLISNAAKFSPRGEPVTISVTCAESSVRIAITDRGSGIPVEFRGRIFQKFAQADSSTTRQKGGSGLGLSISRSIIERLGGKIGFETADGIGTTFYVDLPIQAVSAVDNALPISQPPRVLICEPDSDTAAKVRALLGQRGVTTDYAADYDQARLLLAQYRYDSMTFSFTMQGENGASWLQELRMNERTAQMPIIIVPDANVGQFRQDNDGVVELANWLGGALDPTKLLHAISRSAQPDQKQQPHILHVEDDIDVQQVVQAILQPVAIVTTAGSVAQAREYLAHHHFDLILLDLGLPDGSGVDALRDLRTNGLPPIPVVIFSARESDQLDRTDYPVAASLVKSRISNEALRDTVMAVVGK